MPGINDEDVALGAPEINGGGKAGDAAANNDYFTGIWVVEISGPRHRRT
jgi:hypothetical protein